MVALRSPSFDVSTSDADESLFLLIGGNWLQGHLPYAEIWDVKPPGLFAIFALAQLVFGPGILAARLVSAFAVFLTSCALFRFSRRHLGGGLVGVGAAMLYPAYSLILYGLRSRPELLLAFLVVIGLDLAVMQWRRAAGGSDYRVVALAGLLFGLAFTVKQTAIFEALLAAGLLSTGSGRGFQRVDWRALLVFGLAGFLPSLGFLIYFTLEGVPALLYMAPFIGATQRLGGDGIGFVEGVLRILPMMKPLLPLFIGALLLCTERHALRASAEADGTRAIGLWTLAATTGMLAMRSMYFQYLIPLVAPLLLATLVVARIYIVRIAETRVRTLAAATMALVLAAYPILWLHFYEQQDAGWSHLPAMAVAELRADGLQSRDSIYVVDQETTIYLLARARIPTRFPQSQHLVCDFALPGTDQAEEIRRTMASAPRFVLVSHQGPWMVCERPDRLDIVHAALAKNYDAQATVSEGGFGIDIYCRKGACPARKFTALPATRNAL